MTSDDRRPTKSDTSSQDAVYRTLTDVTHRGDDFGFDVARRFVEELVEESGLGLATTRCIFVPGNHDIQRRDEFYEFTSHVGSLAQEFFVKQGDIFLVRNEAEYHHRMKQFSDAFYHKVTSFENGCPHNQLNN